jgi:hypothetical protein
LAGTGIAGECCRIFSETDRFELELTQRAVPSCAAIQQECRQPDRGSDRCDRRGDRDPTRRIAAPHHADRADERGIR